MRSILARFVKVFSITAVKSAVIAGVAVVGVAGATTAVVINSNNNSQPGMSEQAQSEQTLQQDKTNNLTANGNEEAPGTPNHQQPTSTTQSSRGQSGCRREEIPYKTTYQNVSHLKKGQTQESGGRNGSLLDCGDGHPVVSSPVDKIVYVGTGLTDEEIQQQQIAAQQEYDKKYMQWVQTRNNAYQSCMNSLPSGYPSKESFCNNQASQQAGPPPKQP